ncbi:hypothetical protein EOPP23_14890 [Endozoicomonas sp. OPT23]|nr:hypothetical protein [Endozoicomonas sp. OPT23]
MALVLATLYTLALPQRFHSKLFMVLVLACAMDESAQYFFPSRDFNLYDFGVTVTGLFVGWCIAKISLSVFMKGVSE